MQQNLTPGDGGRGQVPSTIDHLLITPSVRRSAVLGVNANFHVGLSASADVCFASSCVYLTGSCLVGYTSQTLLVRCIVVISSTAAVCYTWMSSGRRRTYMSMSRVLRRYQAAMCRRTHHAAVSRCPRLARTLSHRPVFITLCSLSAMGVNRCRRRKVLQ